MHITIIRIKKYQKLINLSLKYKECYLLGNIISWVRYFLKIYLKFYSNITSHNQTYQNV